MSGGNMGIGGNNKYNMVNQSSINGGNGNGNGNHHMKRSSSNLSQKHM